MSETLKGMLDAIEAMLRNAQMDYDALLRHTIDADFFEDYNRTRIVNSFLFNFGKLQDKIGAKLFAKALYESKEIDDKSPPMLDVLNILEKRDVLSDISAWDRLREIRNILAHEYPFDVEERIENIAIAMEGFEELKAIYAKLRDYLQPIMD